MVAAAKDKDNGEDDDPAAGIVFKKVTKAVVVHCFSSVKVRVKRRLNLYTLSSYA